MITHPTCDIPLTSYISDSFAPNKCDAFNLSSSRCLSGRDINYHVTVTVRLGALQHCAAARIKGWTALGLHLGGEGGLVSCLALNVVNLHQSQL